MGGKAGGFPSHAEMNDGAKSATPQHPPSRERPGQAGGLAWKAARSASQGLGYDRRARIARRAGQQSALAGRSLARQESIDRRNDQEDARGHDKQHRLGQDRSAAYTCDLWREARG